MAAQKGFAAYVEIHVKKVSAKQLGDEIQGSINQVRQIDIGQRLKVTNASLSTLKTQIQEKLKKSNFKVNVKINHIDARDAIEDVRRQLEAMLQSMNLNRQPPNNNPSNNNNNNGGSIITDLKRQQMLLGQIAELQRQVNELRMNNAGSNRIGELDNRAADLEQLRAAVEIEDAADREAMENHRLHYESNRTLVRQWREELSGVALEEQRMGHFSQERINELNQFANRVQQLYNPLTSAEGAASKLQGAGAAGFLQRIEALRPEIEALQRDIIQFANTGVGNIDTLNERFIDLSRRVNQVSIDLGNSKLNDPSMGDAAARYTTQQANLMRRVDQQIRAVDQLFRANSKLNGTALGSQLRQAQENVIRLRGEFDTTADRSTANLDRIRAALSSESEKIEQIRLRMIETGQTGNTLITRLKNGLQKFGGWTIITRALTAAIRLAKQVVVNVKEIDAAMGQLRIVTQASSSDLEKYADKIQEVANRTGASITDLIDSTTTYARLGYTLDESSNLAAYTSMLSKVGDIDISDAQSAVTAITKAFEDVDASKIETVMDKLVKVGNNFPISTAEIAEGMNNASSALAASGNTFEKSVALLTAANATVQDISKASTGLRTITARLRNTTTDLNELGEDMTESKYEDLVRTLTKSGVELRNSAGEYRDTYDIFADLAAKWGELTNMEQSALANAIAGTRMQNVFFSIIQNFREASGAMDSMSSSAGTLETSYNMWLDTTEGKLSQLNTTFQQFSQTVLNSSTSNFFVSLAQGAVQFATALSKIHVLLPLIIAGITVWRTIQRSRDFTALTAKILQQRVATEQDIVAVQGLSAAQRQLILTQLDLARSTGQITQQQRDNIATQLGFNAAEVSGVAATNGLNFSLKGLWATIRSNPIGLILTALTIVISIIQAVSDNAERSRDELIQSSQDIVNANRELLNQASQLAVAQGAIQSYISATVLTAEEEQSFASAVNSVSDALGGKTISLNDTTEKQKEYLELLKQTSKEEHEASLIAARNASQAARTGLEETAKKDPNKVPLLEEPRLYNPDSHAAEVFRKYINPEDLVLYSYGNAMAGSSWDFERGEYIDTSVNLKLLAPSETDAQSILDFYERLVAIRDEIAGQTDDAQRAADMDSDIYKQAVLRIEALKDAVQSVKDTDVALFLQENPIPDTVQNREQYEAFIDSAIDQYGKLQSSSEEYKKSIKELLYQYGTVYPNAVQKTYDAQGLEVKSAEAVVKAYKDMIAEMERYSVKASETKFGNIDTNDRQVLKWTTDNLEKYQEAIKSWDMSVNELAGSISTVLGASDEFDGIEIAFSPMLQTANGAELLDKDTVYDYINGLIDAAGEGWSREDLFRLDAEGLEVDGKKIKNLLADIGTTAIRTGQVMHFTGKDGALALGVKELQQMADEYGVTVEELLKRFDAKDVTTPAALLAEDLKTLSTELSNIKSAYSTVGSAIQEYYKNGVLSSDTLSKLISLEPEYLNLLVDENGQLNLNSQSYETLIKAKMRDMILTRMQSSFDTVLSMNAEEAAAYATATAYDTETDSIYALLRAKAQIALADAGEKDRANNTNVYTQAVIRTLKSYEPLIAAVDNYSLSTDEATGTTDKATKALNKQKDALDKTKKALDEYKSDLSDAQSEIKSLIDLVIDYIKQQKDSEKEVLEERKKNFDELIDKEKEELQLKKEAEEFDRKLRDKQNSYAKDTLAASVASLDDSAAGRKAQKVANDNLIKSRDDLQELLSEHEYDIREKALDQLKEQNDEYYDGEIKKVEDYLANARQLYIDACTLIENDTGSLYGELWAYVYKYTTQTRAEFDDLWNKAHEALSKYDVAQRGVIGVMEFLQGAINATKDEIDRVERSIDSVSDAIQNLADNALDQVASKLGAVRGEYEKLIKDAESGAFDNGLLGWLFKQSNGEPIEVVAQKLQDILRVGTQPNGTALSSASQKLQNILRASTQPYGNILYTGSQKPLNDLRASGYKYAHYASGTLSAAGGLSEVNEQGHEIRILNKGDGILTAKITKNLSSFGADPTRFLVEAGKRLLSRAFNGSAPALVAGAGARDINSDIHIVVQGDATQTTVKAIESVADRIVARATRNIMNIAVRNKNLI